MRSVRHCRSRKRVYQLRILVHRVYLGRGDKSEQLRRAVLGGSGTQTRKSRCTALRNNNCGAANAERTLNYLDAAEQRLRLACCESEQRAIKRVGGKRADDESMRRADRQLDIFPHRKSRAADYTRAARKRDYLLRGQLSERTRDMGMRLGFSRTVRGNNNDRSAAIILSDASDTSGYRAVHRSAYLTYRRGKQRISAYSIALVYRRLRYPSGGAVEIQRGGLGQRRRVQPVYTAYAHRQTYTAARGFEFWLHAAPPYDRRIYGINSKADDRL